DALAAGAAVTVAMILWLGLGGRRDLGRPVTVIDPDPPAGEPPPVTVVIPTKNRPDYVRRAVAHVLAQDGPPRELIVVDSSDDERTQELLRAEFPDVRRVRVLGMPNNRHFAKNQGIRLARGALVCFLDDDSFAEPGWLERLSA